jgi:ATP-dependent Clp protease ATP-binding subunit ClpA
MATKQELEQKLKDLKDSLGAVPQEFVKDIEAEIAETEKQLQGVDASAPEKVQEAPTSEDDFLKTMISSFATMMASGEGTGVDSPTIRGIIKDYLQEDKVKLDELDKSILEEIKKNQTVILQIPAFGKQIQISSAVSRIPNFFEIIDDVLAGNNVYLIGEAGGGKTYTAEQVAQTLGREAVTLNCSQYTSPLEILGGQSIDGFKEGKLIDCWKNGKVLILDEMPKLDANTAGLFNDALAKSSKTRP